MKTDLTELMGQIGPADDAIGGVFAFGDDRFVVSLGDTDITVDRDAATNRLMFSCPCGLPSRERREQVYEALLLYTSLWRETGGVRMGLVEPGGEVVQMADIFVDDATPALVVTILKNLSERVGFWRDFLTASPAATAQMPVPELSMSGFIRG